MAEHKKGKAGSQHNPVQLNALISVKPAPSFEEIKFVGKADGSLKEVLDKNTIGTFKSEEEKENSEQE